MSSDALLQGWEVSCKRHDNRGVMIRAGTKVSHKCLEAQGSQNTYNVLHIKGKRYNISSHTHGQHDSPVMESGECHKPEFDCSQQRNLEMPFEKNDLNTAE